MSETTKPTRIAVKQLVSIELFTNEADLVSFGRTVLREAAEKEGLTFLEGSYRKVYSERAYHVPSDALSDAEAPYGKMVPEMHAGFYTDAEHVGYVVTWEGDAA